MPVLNMTGGASKPEQEKSVSIASNGSVDITPDTGKVLSAAHVTVAVPSKEEQEKSVTITESCSVDVLPDAGKALSAVHVTVNEPAPDLEDITITENGTYTHTGHDGYDEVTVAVPTKEEQEKTTTITANGVYEITPDANKALSKVTANVQVSGGGSVLVPLSATSNGTYLPSAYSADGFSRVTVNTPSFIWPRHYVFTQIGIFNSIHIEE